MQRQTESAIHTALALLGKTGRHDRLDMATRMPMDADFWDKGDPGTARQSRTGHRPVG
jgi:hypothetical protein